MHKTALLTTLVALASAAALFVAAFAGVAVAKYAVGCDTAHASAPVSMAVTVYPAHTTVDRLVLNHVPQRDPSMVAFHLGNGVFVAVLATAVATVLLAIGQLAAACTGGRAAHIAATGLQLGSAVVCGAYLVLFGGRKAELDSQLGHLSVAVEVMPGVYQLVCKSSAALDTVGPVVFLVAAAGIAALLNVVLAVVSHRRAPKCQAPGDGLEYGAEADHWDASIA